MPTPESSPTRPTPGFADSEGLRAMLTRLHEAGPGSWQRDAEAAELMRFAADRYAALARKYDLEPADAAAAAFEAMRNNAVRTALDPWAVVTVAVRKSLIAEQRAQGMLTSTHRARRPEYSCFHDAERISDRDTDLADYHPAFHVRHDWDRESDESPYSAPTPVDDAVNDTVRLLTTLGWPVDAARTGVDYVTSRLADIGDRASSYDVLRRDKAARAVLDMPHESWIGLLRTVLGHPSAPTHHGRLGVLARLLIGDTIDDLVADSDLVRITAAANPGRVAMIDG